MRFVSEIKSRPVIVSVAVALLCFMVHAALIFHHTYFTASARNTRQFPNPQAYATENIPISNPERWHNFLDLNRWDSAYYEQIVKDGYKAEEGSETPRNIIWYPGYPLLAKPIYWLTGWPPTFIFSILSASFTLLFWLILWSPPMADRLGKKALTISSALVICWPGAFYWFAGMTEPLISLILVLLIFLWVTDRFHPAIPVLAFATSAKQVFIPVSIAFFSLQYIRKHPPLKTFLLKWGVTLAGFICFGLYQLIAFGNFFLASDTCLRIYQKKVSFAALIDLSHYAKNIWSLGGATVFFSMVLLLVVFLKLLDLWPDGRSFAGFFKSPQPELSLELVLWWMALACTAFYVVGSAYGQFPFNSTFRYQTTNMPLFLLAAFQIKALRWWKTVLLLFPILWAGVFWQEIYTAQYWLWKWIA